MKRVSIILMLLALMLTGCKASGSTQTSATTPGVDISVQGGSYRDVSVSELETMLENKDFVFVNVHIPFEGDIPDTDLSIPYDEIESHLDELPADKDAKIVLYCRSDRMSNIAAEKLVSLGYSNIWNLDGGFAAWEAEGLPIER